MDTCDTLQFRKLLQVDAADSILCKLAHLPQVEKLATRVCAFYSDFLEYYEGTELTSSRYQINLQNEPVTLKSVRIELQIRSPRFVEALVHELLHLGVRMNGFPIGHAFTVPYEINRHADYFIGYYPKFVNILEHELIINDFLNFGFDKKNFLSCLSPAPDYRQIALTTPYSLGYIEDIDFSWWCLEYFRHWVSTRHWVGDEAALYANNALFWGSKIHHSLKTTARQIRELILSNVLRDRKAHHLYVNKLLKLMKIPVFTSWVTLQSNENGKPVAKKVFHDHWPFPGIHSFSPLMDAPKNYEYSV